MCLMSNIREIIYSKLKLRSGTLLKLQQANFEGELATLYGIEMF